MRYLFAATSVLCGAAILPGCATRASVETLESRVTQVGAELAQLRREADAIARETTPVVLDFRTLSARLQEMESRLRDVGDRIAVLDNRVAATEASVRGTVATVDAPRATATAAVPERPAAERRAARSAAASPEQVFAAALTAFRAGEHGQAVLDLTDFIAKHAKHPLAASAQLWIGEAYFTQRDYDQALVEYRKAADVARGSPVAADALLRLGRTYALLHQRAAATAAWQRVVREHPDTAAAVRARALLRK